MSSLKLLCVCGSVYDAESLKALTYMGSSDIEELGDQRLDIRQCLCSYILCVDNLEHPFIRMRTEIFNALNNSKIYEGAVMRILDGFSFSQVRQLLRYAIDTMQDEEIFLMHDMCTTTKEELLKRESKDNIIRLIFRFSTHLKGVVKNAMVGTKGVNDA